MPKVELPIEIRFMAGNKRSIKHISTGSTFHDEVLCGAYLSWPFMIEPQINLSLFGLCRTCEKVYMSALDKLIEQAENNGLEVHTRKGGTKA